MKIISTVSELRPALELLRKEEPKRPLVFTATLGCLHKGHESMFSLATKSGGWSAVSIFLNPLQFSDPNDYKIYPSNLEQDLELCKKNQVDLVFAPSKEEFYSQKPLLKMQIPSLTDVLCGLGRKGHFEGVMYIVARLLCLFMPDKALFGKKDYQQYRIICQMVSEFGLPIEIQSVETVREDDGLAFSSRNLLLSPKAREAAGLIYRSLKMGKKAVDEGERDLSLVSEIVRDIILSNSLNRIDYVDTVEEKTLRPLKMLEKKTEKTKETTGFLLAVAVFCENTRLIDNIECSSS